MRLVRVGEPLVERVVAPAVVDAAGPPKGQRSGEVRGLRRPARLLGRRPLVAARTVDGAGLARPRAAGTPGGTARQRLGRSSRDRHRHAQRRDRPHADRAELPARPPPPREPGPDARRRQGHQRRPRAEALGVPVVATGLAGGRTGTRIVEELTAEAILNDFVRIARRVAHLDRRRRPDRRRRTRRSTSGARTSSRRSSRCCATSSATSPGAPRPVVFAGSLPRGVADDFYAEAIRELNRRGVHTVLDAEGQPLRLGLEAEPLLVSPNQREAEQLVGQEFHEDEDFVLALDTIAELGARNVLLSHENGCFGLFREERRVTRLRAVAPRGRRRVGGRRGRRAARGVPRRPRRSAAGGRGVARGRRGRHGLDARGRRGPLRPDARRARWPPRSRSRSSSRSRRGA